MPSLSQRQYWPALKRTGLLTCLLVLCSALTPFVVNGTQVHHEILSATTTKSFHAVIEDIEYAIAERNFRITGRNTVGSGIQAREHPHFPNMEIIHFCSLEYARELLEIDPGFLVQMPCRISAREQGKRTVIEAPLLPTQHRNHQMRIYIQRMNTLIREIVRFGAN